MNQTARSRLAILMLIASGLAFMATSQAPGTTEVVEGETVVGPDHPGTFGAHFDVGRPSGATFASLNVLVDAPRGGDSRVAVEAAITANGTTVRTAPETDIDPSLCTGGCSVDVRATVRWVGPGEAPLSVRWTVTLNAAAAADAYSTVPVTGSAVEGRPPAVSSVGWLGLGALLAAATTIGWLIAGSRFRRLRIAFMAGMAVLPVLGVIDLASRDTGVPPSLTDVLAGAVLLLIALGLLILGVGFSIRAYMRGNPTYVAVDALVYAVLAGGLAVVTAGVMPTYRPYELVAFGLVVGAPAAAALGSLRDRERSRSSRVVSSSLVFASQILLIAAYGFATLTTLPAGLLSLVVAVTERHREVLFILLQSAVVDLLPAGILALLAVGLVRWRRGHRRVLVIANVIALLPMIFIVLAASLMTTLLGPFVLFFALPGALVGLAALVGIVAGIAAPAPTRPMPSAISGGPPPSRDDGHEQRGEGDEITGVLDKADRSDAGNQS